MIIGVGCDIVDSRRIKKLYEKNPEILLARILSTKEKARFASFEANSKKQISYLAKRFASKEALSKAFGLGLGRELSFIDIVVCNDENGAPYIELPEDFSYKGYKDLKIDISISDEWPMAVAFVIVTKL